MDHSSIYKKLDKLFEALVGSETPFKEIAPDAAKSEIVAGMRNKFIGRPFVSKKGWGKKTDQQLGQKVTPQVHERIKKVKNVFNNSAGKEASLDPESKTFYDLFKEVGFKDPIEAINRFEKAVLIGLTNVVPGGNPEQNAVERMKAILAACKPEGLTNPDAIRIIIEAFEDSDISKFRETAQTAKSNLNPNKAPQRI